jgi:gamma-glutamylcyclotransferase (GGCT)/AIG2-like uncharacterized protein YtfP
MTLYFAYGSNMSKAGMAARCPDARAVGTAMLAGWRFVIAESGYASIVPAARGKVFGVLWQLAPRDVAALNAYENVDDGLYLRRTLTVRRGGDAKSAMVYIARNGGEGRPRRGYLDLVIGAAREWDLPADYICELQSWSRRGARARIVGAVR